MATVVENRSYKNHSYPPSQLSPPCATSAAYIRIPSHPIVYAIPPPYHTQGKPQALRNLDNHKDKQRCSRPEPTLVPAPSHKARRTAWEGQSTPPFTCPACWGGNQTSKAKLSAFSGHLPALVALDGQLSSPGKQSLDKSE